MEYKVYNKIQEASEEMGDLIALIRQDYLRLTPMELSRQISTKVDTIEKSEKGTTAHGFATLKKTCDRFDLKLEILISKK